MRERRCATISSSGKWRRKANKRIESFVDPLNAPDPFYSSDGFCKLLLDRHKLRSHWIDSFSINVIAVKGGVASPLPLRSSAIQWRWPSHRPSRLIIECSRNGSTKDDAAGVDGLVMPCWEFLSLSRTTEREKMRRSSQQQQHKENLNIKTFRRFPSIYIDRSQMQRGVNGLGLDEKVTPSFLLLSSFFHRYSWAGP